MKIGIVLGTRPEIIKLSSIIRELEAHNMDYFVIHTNQHYSRNLDGIFFDDLKLHVPKYNLNVGSGSHAYQTSKMIEKIETIFLNESPSIVLVQGDTNSVLGGALTASKMNIPVGHIEAGLRSYDRKMPEEKNRIIVDHISDFLFCPTNKQKEILMKEGISENKIFIVGNTIVDAVNWVEDNGSNVLERLKLKKSGFFLLTLHRAENVDNYEKLKNIIDKLEKLEELKMNVIFLVHPRTKNSLEKFSIKMPEFIKPIEPLGFIDMVTMEKNAKAIFTDSGGIQEEACILKIPCITLRTSTERPETVEVGANKLNSGDLIKDYYEMTQRQFHYANPFGDGNTGKTILKIINQSLKTTNS